MHGEAQRVMQNLKLERWWKNFELDCFPMPTFDIFQDLIRDSAAQNVVVAYFAGHCGEGGALCFNTVGSNVEMEMLGPDQVAPVIARASNGVSEGPAEPRLNVWCSTHATRARSAWRCGRKEWRT